MRRKGGARIAVLAVLACLLFSCGRRDAVRGAAAWPVARVLFVGNSYTFVNDLPARIQALAESGDGPVAFEVESVTVGSATLLDHARKTGALQKIAQGGWTYVVLQGQSVEPASSPKEFERGALELAAKVTEAGATPVFYETWARAAGSDIYAKAWSGGSPAAMQEKIRSEYAKVARETNGRLVPAGQAWARALDADPKAPLFSSDGSHPAAAGTYLTACVFYAVLTGRSPVGLAARPWGVSAGEGAKWQSIAWDASSALLSDAAP